MSIPDSVTALAQARMDARAAKDFALADKYRDELLQAGFEVVDVAGGYELRPKKPYITLAYPRDIRTIDLEKDVTVGLIVDGFTDDALETVKTIKEENIYSLETKSEPKQQIMYIYICLKVSI